MNFENSLKVVSSARKLIFRVPNGPLVSFPEGAAISPYGQNNTTPVVVVKNHIDQSVPGGTWQGADAENGVLIMNAVPENIANMLLDDYGANPTIRGLNEVIELAEANQCVDNYTTKVSFVDTKLSPAGRMLGPYTGIVKRDDRDVCLVIRDANGVIQRKLGNDVKHIDTDEILVRDYVNVDGSKIDVSTIPVCDGKI